MKVGRTKVHLNQPIPFNMRKSCTSSSHVPGKKIEVRDFIQHFEMLVALLPNIPNMLGIFCEWAKDRFELN